MHCKAICSCNIASVIRHLAVGWAWAAAGRRAQRQATTAAMTTLMVLMRPGHDTLTIAPSPPTTYHHMLVTELCVEPESLTAR